MTTRITAEAVPPLLGGSDDRRVALFLTFELDTHPDKYHHAMIFPGDGSSETLSADARNEIVAAVHEIARRINDG